MKTIRGRVGALVAVSFFIGIGSVSNARAQSMFNHSIPIKVPKGANGMQPEIALVYDPGAGNGIVGVGWQLAGLSAITRVNYGSGIQCSGGDTYAHTQLGILMAQPDGSYRSKRESFTKLVPSSSCGNGPCSWTAYDRSGTQFVYGATADSTLACGATGTVLTWALSKVVDLFGNSYEVGYSKDNGQLYPSVITYTKGPGLTTYRTIEFAYEGRADPDPGGYPQGYYQQLTFRLKWISVKSGGALLHQYRLDYGEYGAATFRSHLTAVQEYGSDGTSTLPAQTFGWQQGGLGFSQQNWTVPNQWGSSDYTWSGDFDGDGRTDIASANGGNIYVKLSTGSGFTQQVWPVPANWGSSSYTWTGDFNGDGKTDIATAIGGNVYVNLSTGSGFTQQVWPVPNNWGTAPYIWTGDFNGDGKTDIATLIGGNIYVNLSTGSGFTQQVWPVPANWSTGGYVWTGDFNGDGKTDIATAIGGNIYVNLSTGSGFTQQVWGVPANWGSADYTWAADFDGDGRTDIATASGGNIYVNRSMGNSFVQSLWTVPNVWAPPNWVRLGDFDGNGKVDIANCSGASVYVDVANGPSNDLLTTVNNGLGGTVTVVYVPAPLVPNAIMPSSGGPGIPNTAPQNLVTSVTTSDGRGGTYATGYGYWDARVLPGTIPNRRNLGFQSVRAGDFQTGQYKQTYFNQSPGYEGLVARVDEVAGVTAPNGSLVSTTAATYDLVYPNAGTELARERQRVVYAYEYTLGQLLFSQTTSTQYDDYGNPTVKVQSADSLPDVTVTTTYVNDTTAWIFGRITEIKTTSGATTLGWMRNTWTGNSITTKSNWLDATNTWISSTMTYDANGNMVSVTEPPTGDNLVRTTTTAYDPTFKTYPISVTNALGQVTQRSYNADGLVVSFTDANTQTTTTSYDVFGRKTGTIRVADGATTTYSYSNSGSVNGVSALYNMVVTKVDATRTVYGKEFFDGSGFVFHTESTGDSGQTICVDFQKDRAGRQYAASTPHYCNATSIAWTRSAYDYAGRLATVTTPDSKVTTYTYGVSSATPNSTRVTDPNGNTTTKYFDARKHVTSIVDAANQTTTYGYDALGRLTSATTPDQAVSKIAYDSLNRKTSMLDPQVGSNTVTFTYDALNRVKSKQAAGETAATYTYDETTVANGIGRLTTVVDASGTTHFAYSSTGPLARRTSTYGTDNFSETFQYDLVDRVTHLTYPDGSYVDYSYTDAGNLATVALNGTTLASYSNYTASGKPGTVTYGNGVSTTYAYDDVNHLTHLSTVGSAAGTIHDLTYDWYTRPNTGGLNIGSITDNRSVKVGPDGVNTDETQTYTYDPLYRLTQAIGVWGTKAYAYDAMGNPTGFAGLVNRTLTFTGQQVTSGTGLSGVTYDGFGNTTHRVIDGVTWDYAWIGLNHLASATRNGTVVAQMTYDADGHRAKKVFTPSTGPTVTTIYFGNFYEKRTYSDGSPARHTVNVFAAGQLLVSVTRAGAIAVAFNDANRWRAEAAGTAMYDGRTFGGAARKGVALLKAAAMHPEAVGYAGLGLSLLFAVGLAAALLMPRGATPRRGRPAWLRLASASVSLVFVSTGCGGPGGGPGGGGLYQRSGYLLSGDTTNGPAIGTYFYHRNHINSSSVITDANGNVTARMVYLPFGELSQANSSGGDVVTSKFTGQEYDEELGLYYFGARYYDPAIGRFISADSIVPSASDAQTFNRYTYARDNPIVYVDPTGHFLDFIGNFFSAVWSGITTIGSAIGAAAVWVANAAVDYTKFCARVGYFIGLTLYGIATNPWALATFVLGAILCVTIVGIPEGLAMWATSVSIAITATSMAQAAGVRNPYVLALIGVAAGVLGGGWSWSQFFKSAGQAAVGMGAAAVGGGPGGLAADVGFMALGSVDPEVNEEDLSLSPEGLDFIRRHEGYSATVYNDAAGNPTIGYGHLIRPGEDFSNGITEAEATQLLAQDVQTAVNAVNNRLNVQVSQNEFDALVDFTYNLGERNLGRSTLLSNINSDNDVTLNNFTDWNRAGGVVIRGLIIRRTDEYNLYTYGNYGH